MRSRANAVEASPPRGCNSLIVVIISVNLKSSRKESNRTGVAREYDCIGVNAATNNEQGIAAQSELRENVKYFLRVLRPTGVIVNGGRENSW